jgi:hypothetical protein
MPKILFHRNRDGGVDLNNLSEIRRYLRDPDREQLTVTREVRVAAEERVIEMTRELCFTSGRPFADALREVQARDPALFALARAGVDLPKHAVAVVAS